MDLALMIIINMFWKKKKYYLIYLENLGISSLDIMVVKKNTSRSWGLHWHFTRCIAKSGGAILTHTSVILFSV